MSFLRNPRLRPSFVEQRLQNDAAATVAIALLLAIMVVAIVLIAVLVGGAVAYLRAESAPLPPHVTAPPFTLNFAAKST